VKNENKNRGKQRARERLTHCYQFFSSFFLLNLLSSRRIHNLDFVVLIRSNKKFELNKKAAQIDAIKIASS
jgi:hypothetical protein